ncbi:MAG: hypothetical protein IH611_03110 [Deltaproteobacteria bacterium]|nr:hypothetical protein [Deltaproteobacteria bacterium]
MWLSAILLTIGAMIGSPEAGLAFSALAALCALVPVVAGPGKARVIGSILLLAALGSAFLEYPAAKRQMGAP